MLDITCAYGLDFLFPSNDIIVGGALRRAGEFARPEVDIIVAMLARLRGTYIDVGANIGSIALPVAATSHGSRVIAIEASRHLANVLAANALNNRLANVDVHHAAAGVAAGLVRVPTPSLGMALNFGAISLTAPDQAGLPHEEVRMCALDKLAPNDTRIVKLDVEGYENDVLDGAQALLARRSAAWIVEHKPDDERSLRLGQRLIDAGYRLFWMWTPVVTPTSPKRAAGPFTSGDFNIFAIFNDEPPVAMTEVADLRTPPKATAAYPYLKQYGY